MLSVIRASLRLSFFISGTLFYIFRYMFKAFFVGNDLDRALRLRRQWTRIFHPVLGVQIETFGNPPTEAGLLVCNHRSYYDPFLILGKVLALPVGKIEVTKWPVIGLAGKVSGAVFVDRHTKEGRQSAREEILETLQNGYCVINYPEGTTHANHQTIDFKPGLFRDAAKEQFIIYPIVHEYQRDEDAWIGDDTFLRHFFECFGKRKTYVRLSYGPQVKSETPEELLQKSKQWIDKELLRLRKDWHFSDPSMIKDESKKMV